MHGTAACERGAFVCLACTRTVDAGAEGRLTRDTLPYAPKGGAPSVGVMAVVIREAPLRLVPRERLRSLFHCLPGYVDGQHTHPRRIRTSRRPIWTSQLGVFLEQHWLDLRASVRRSKEACMHRHHQCLLLSLRVEFKCSVIAVHTSDYQRTNNSPQVVLSRSRFIGRCRGADRRRGDRYVVAALQRLGAKRFGVHSGGLRRTHAALPGESSL